MRYKYYTRWYCSTISSLFSLLMSTFVRVFFLFHENLDCNLFWCIALNLNLKFFDFSSNNHFSLHAIVNFQYICRITFKFSLVHLRVNLQPGITVTMMVHVFGKIYCHNSLPDKISICATICRHNRT